LVLLAIRVPLTDLNILYRIFGPAPLPPGLQVLVLLHDQLYYAFSRLAILIVAIVILINRRDLSKMNLDGPFLLLLLWGTLAFCRDYLWPVGWAALLLAIYIALTERSDRRQDHKSTHTVLRVTCLILIAFFLCLILLRDALNLNMVRSAVYWFLILFPPAAVVEEFTFRGLLWMFLKNLGWAEGWIVIVQAVLFWLAHTEYLLTNPVAFWAVVPIQSLALGLIAWRTRSITPSTIAHICINVFWFIFYAAK
jgi:membrane protease YdiL (CAAX protease family)